MKTAAAHIFLNYCQLNGHKHTAEVLRSIVERERAEAGDAAKSSAAVPCDLFAPAMSSMPLGQETPPNPAQSTQEGSALGIERSNWEWPCISRDEDSVANSKRRIAYYEAGSAAVALAGKVIVETLDSISAAGDAMISRASFREVTPEQRQSDTFQL